LPLSFVAIAEKHKRSMRFYYRAIGIKVVFFTRPQPLTYDIGRRARAFLRYVHWAEFWHISIIQVFTQTQIYCSLRFRTLDKRFEIH
jgi:hypothetical protein